MHLDSLFWTTNRPPRTRLAALAARWAGWLGGRAVKTAVWPNGRRCRLRCYLRPVSRRAARQATNVELTVQALCRIALQFPLQRAPLGPIKLGFDATWFDAAASCSSRLQMLAHFWSTDSTDLRSLIASRKDHASSDDIRGAFSSFSQTSFQLSNGRSEMMVLARFALHFGRLARSSAVPSLIDHHKPFLVPLRLACTRCGFSSSTPGTLLSEHRPVA